MVFDAFLSFPISVFELGYIQIFGLILLTFLHSSAKSSFRAYLEGTKEVPKRCINLQRDDRAPETKYCLWSLVQPVLQVNANIG